MIRKLFLKIKRWWFYKTTGFYLEDIKRLVYFQKYIEHQKRKDGNYNKLLKEHFENRIRQNADSTR